MFVRDERVRIRFRFDWVKDMWTFISAFLSRIMGPWQRLSYMAVLGLGRSRDGLRRVRGV